MKQKSRVTKAVLTSVALLCLSGADAWAHAPRARELCGVIQTIDRKNRTLIVQSPKRDRPLKVVWRRDTDFIQDGKLVSADTLKAETRGCVYYHSPFFGKPFVTKVVWTDSRQRSPERKP